MAAETVVICRMCGLVIRATDSVAKVDGTFLHAPCAETAYSDRPDWAHTEIGTLNQLARGAISGGGVV